MKKTLLVVILTLAAPLAQAQFISFKNIADGNVASSDGSILTGAAGEAGWQPFQWDFGGGLVLTVRGYETNGAATDTESYAYLDKGNAGIGVCTNLNNATSKQCAPSSDDNVSFGEYLALSFSQAVTMSSLVLNNNHDGGFINSMVNINGTDTAMADGTGGKTVAGSWNLGAGDIFSLAYTNLSSEPPESNSRENHFYLESLEVSAVPAPPALLLFGTGLIGLIGFSKRRKAA